MRNSDNQHMTHTLLHTADRESSHAMNHGGSHDQKVLGFHMDLFQQKKRFSKGPFKAAVVV